MIGQGKYIVIVKSATEDYKWYPCSCPGSFWYALWLLFKSWRMFPGLSHRIARPTKNVIEMCADIEKWKTERKKSYSDHERS